MMEPREPLIRKEFFPRSQSVVQPVYVREVILECYGQGHPFGAFDQETSTVTITDASALGEVTASWVASYCEDMQRRGNPFGSHILFNVPKKIYELRERAKYDVEDDVR